MFCFNRGGGEGEERELVTGREGERWEEKQQSGTVPSAFIPPLADAVNKSGVDWFIWGGRCSAKRKTS